MKKTLAIITLASLLGASGLKAANPEYEFYITGSTAFQKTAYNAITNLFGSGYLERNSSGAGNAGGAIWAISGTMNSVFGISQPVQVHATWNGSVQGIYGLQTPTFTTVFTNADGSNGGSHQPTVCFSDVDSISTAYPLSGDYAEYHVAVQPFVWCRSLGAPATITNVTMQVLATISQNSKANLSIFTGNTNDAGTNIFLANRNTDSGTRVDAFADIASSGPSTIYYYSNTISPNGWYASTFNQGPALFGAGYSSGGNEAGALGASGANNVAVGYCGLGNISADNNGQNVLKYNGVWFSSDYNPGTTYSSTPSFSYDNVINGSYTFWAYECLDCPVTTAPRDNTTVVIANIQTFTRALAGYNSSDVFVGGPGSVDYDVTNNASFKLAVSLNAMHVKRDFGNVGGPLSKAIFPIQLGR